MSLGGDIADVQRRIDAAHQASSLSNAKVETIRFFSEKEKEYTSRPDYENFNDHHEVVAEFEEGLRERIKDQEVLNAFMPYLEGYKVRFDSKVGSLANEKFVMKDQSALGGELDTLVNVSSEFPDYQKVLQEIRPNAIAAIAGREASGVIDPASADRLANEFDERLWGVVIDRQMEIDPISLEGSLRNYDNYPGLSPEKRSFWMGKAEVAAFNKRVDDTIGGLVSKYGTDFDAMRAELAGMEALGREERSKILGHLETTQDDYQKEYDSAVWESIYTALDVDDKKAASKALGMAKDFSPKDAFEAKKLIKGEYADDDRNRYYRAMNTGDYKGAMDIASGSQFFEEKERGDKYSKAEDQAAYQSAKSMLAIHDGDVNAARDEIEGSTAASREIIEKVSEKLDIHYEAHKKKVEAIREAGKEKDLEAFHEYLIGGDYASASKAIENSEYLTTEEKYQKAKTISNRKWSTDPEIENSISKDIANVDPSDATAVQKVANKIKLRRGDGLSNSVSDKLASRLDGLVKDPASQKRFKDALSYAESRWKSFFPKKKDMDRYYQYENFSNMIADELLDMERQKGAPMSNMDMVNHVNDFFEEKVIERGLMGVDWLFPDKKYIPVKELFNEDDAGQLGSGKRQDGSEKGPGFLGEIKNPDGSVSTELSIGVNIDGKDIDIPLLVPGLTPEEILTVQTATDPNDPNDPKNIPKEIEDKAVEHARQRMSDGKSPFLEQGEEQAPKKVKVKVVRQPDGTTEAIFPNGTRRTVTIEDGKVVF